MKALKFIFLICLISYESFSQDVSPVAPAAPSNLSVKILPRFNMRASVDIPKVISSQAFGASFSGIFDANFSVNFRLFSNFNFGVGYDGAVFVNQLYFRQEGRNTRLQVHDGFLRLGYDVMDGGKRFWTFSLSSGLSYNLYTAVTAKNDSLNARPKSWGNSPSIRTGMRYSQRRLLCAMSG